MPPRHGAAACRPDVERDLRLPYNKHFVALQEVWTMVSGLAAASGLGSDAAVEASLRLSDKARHDAQVDATNPWETDPRNILVHWRRPRPE